MELLRPCLFIYLLAILLSLSISLTTNSDHIYSEEFEWKGGDGVKRSRVRRQNLHLPDALSLPEKAYVLFILWRLLDDVSNDSKTIRTSTMRPYKLEFMSSEGPKNTEIIYKAKDKPSSAPTQEQSTHSTGIAGTNDSAKASLTSSTDSKKTTQSQLVKQSTQRLQTTIQKIPEPGLVTEQHNPDSTTLTIKISSKAVEEPPSATIHERIDYFTGITDTKDSTAKASFPTHSQETTQTGDYQLVKQSIQQLQTTIQKPPETSQDTEQHNPDSTTLPIKNYSKAMEEPSSTIIHERIDHFTGITDSTTMTSFPTHSPDSQKKTQSGDSQLAEHSSTITKQKITEPSQVREQHIPHSKTFTIKMSSKAVEETSLDTMHEESTDSTGTNDSTAITSFTTELPPQESQNNTQSGAPQPFTQSTQHLQHSKPNSSEPSQVTEQHIIDSTTLTINISKAAEEPHSATIHERIDHYTGITDTKDSTAKASFPTHSQETTQSGDYQLVKQSIQRLQTTIQKPPETSQDTEQHNPDSTTLPIKNYSKAMEEPSSTIIHERIDHFTGITDSTTMTSFPTHSPDSQKKTQSGDSQLAEHSSTITKQKITEPSQVREQHIPHSKTFTIKMSSKAVEETSLDTMHEESTDSTGTNDSTAITSFTTELPPQESQNNTQSGAPQPFTQSTQHLQHSKPNSSEPSQVTEQHIIDSTTLTINISKAAEEPHSATIHERIDHYTGITDTKDSTAKASFPTHSQETTQSGDYQLVKQSIQRLQTTIQKPPETSQDTEQHNPDSTTLPIKNYSKAMEEPSSTIIQERIDHFTGITDSTTMTSFPTHSPDSQKKTQSGDSQLAEHSSTITKQKITEPSQVREQHIPHSKTFTIKMSSKAVEETSLDAMHEESTDSTGTNDSTAITSFTTELPPQESQNNTQPGAPQPFTQSTQHLQHSKPNSSEPSQVTEQHIIDSTTLTINISKAAEEPHSATIHERIDHFTGITDTKDSTAKASFPTHSQETTQSGDYQLVKQSIQRLQTTIQKPPETSQDTEQHNPDSTTLPIKNDSKAMEEPSSTIIHERIDHFTGITDSTTMTSFPTHSPDSQKKTQSGDSQLVKQSIQRLQTTIQKPKETSQDTEQHNPDSTTLPIKNYSKAMEEPPSATIHERIDHFTDITDTKDSTAKASFPTHSQETTQSGDSQLVKQSIQQLQTTIQKPPETSQDTEQHNPDSTTLPIKNYSKAVEEPPSTIIHERIDHFTGITDSTTMTSFPTHSPDSQKKTQSGDSQLAEHSSTITKQKITEPSQVMEQHIPHSKTFTIKMSATAVEETFLDTMHEESTDSTGTNDSIGTNDSTAITSFTTKLPPQESQNNTQPGAPQPFTQSTQHLQHLKPNSSEPSQVTEQHITDSTTLTINISKAVEEPSSATIHEQIDHYTGITDTKDSTAKASFPTHSQETTQSGDSQLVKQSIQRLQTTIQKPSKTSQVTEQHNPDSTTLPIKNYSKAVEEPPSATIHERIDHFTGITDTKVSTAMSSFPTHSQKTTQSGDSQQAEHSSAITKHKISQPSQVMEQHIPHSKTFTIKMSSRAVEETSLDTMHEESTDSTSTNDSSGTNDSTAITSFTTELPPQESQNNTQSGAPHLFTQSTQHLQHSKPNSSEQSQVTEQYIIDYTTLPIKNYSKAAEEPHSATIHQRIDHFTGITDTKVSTAMSTFPTHSQKATPSGDSQLAEHSSTITKQKITEPSQVTEQHIQSSKAVTETSLDIMSEESTHSTGTNYSTAFYSSISSKIASTSPLPSLTEDRLVDSKGPGNTSVPTGTSLHLSTSSAAPFTTYHRNLKTQSQSTTNKYPILGSIISHTSVLLAKDTSTQAPTDKVRPSQTISASTEKLTVTFTPNTKPSEKHIHTTSVVRRGFLTLRTPEIPSSISTKQSNLHSTETKEPRSDLKNQEPTADIVANENYTNKDLLTEMDKPMQSTIGGKLSKTTRPATTKLHKSKTQKVSRNPKKFILPTHKSADTAMQDHIETRRGIFGLFFTFGCFLLLIIVILLWVVWRRWQARRWRNDMWVAGPPLMWGTYHSVLQSSSIHTPLEMRKGNTQKNKRENSDVYKSIALKQQHKDLQ